MWRLLRTTAACFCLVLFVVCMWAWWFTYSANHEVFNQFEESAYYGILSWKGKVRFGLFGGGKTRKIGRWTGYTVPDERMYSTYAEYSKEWRSEAFTAVWNQYDKNMSLPYWSLVLIFGVLAMALKPKPRLKFSITDFILLTTVAAIVITAIVTFARALNS